MGIYQPKQPPGCRYSPAIFLLWGGGRCKPTAFCCIHCEDTALAMEVLMRRRLTIDKAGLIDCTAVGYLSNTNSVHVLQLFPLDCC